MVKLEIPIFTHHLYGIKIIAIWETPRVIFAPYQNSTWLKSDNNVLLQLGWRIPMTFIRL